MPELFLGRKTYCSVRTPRSLAPVPAQLSYFYNWTTNNAEAQLRVRSGGYLSIVTSTAVLAYRSVANAVTFSLPVAVLQSSRERAALPLRLPLPGR